MNEFEKLKKKVRAWEQLEYLVGVLIKSKVTELSVNKLQCLMSRLVGEKAAIGMATVNNSKKRALQLAEPDWWPEIKIRGGKSR